jgi:hypothetical protein
MSQTQWWPATVFLLVMYVPSFFMTIRRRHIPRAVRQDGPSWLVLFGAFGPAIIMGIAGVLAWWLRSIWPAIAGVCLFQLIRIVRHRFG